MNQLYEFIYALNYSETFIWKQNLEKVKEYIFTHKECPSIGRNRLLAKYGSEYPIIQHSLYRDPETKKLGNWVRQQKIHYKNKNCGCIINTKPEIRHLWESTINDPIYKPHLYFNKVQKWKHALEKVKEFIRETGELPTNQNMNPETKKLAIWIQHQTRNYRNKKQFIMKTPEIKRLWEEFVN
jgi:hypothetical protein